MSTITLEELKDLRKKTGVGVQDCKEALEKSNWVKTKAAKLLNINRTTLVEKIKKQNLTETAAG